MDSHECPLTIKDIETVKSINNKEESIIHMQEDIESLKDDVKLIKNALLGDGYNIGFKQRIELVEMDSTILKKNQDKILTIVHAIIAVLGVIGVVVGILSKTGIL